MKKNFNGLLYYFEGDSEKERFDEFQNGIKLFDKIKSSDMKLEKENKNAKWVSIKSKRNSKKKI